MACPDWRGGGGCFVLEGLRAVALGFVVLFYLPDQPEHAPWLTLEEQNWLTARIRAEEEHRAQRHSLTLWQVLSDGRVWLLILLYLSLAASATTMGFYLPKLIDQNIPGLNKLEIA